MNTYLNHKKLKQRANLLASVRKGCYKIVSWKKRITNFIEDETWDLEKILEKIHFTEKKQELKNDENDENGGNDEGVNDQNASVVSLNSPSFKITKNKSGNFIKSKNKFSHFLPKNKELTSSQFMELLHLNKETKRKRLYSDESHISNSQNVSPKKASPIKIKTRQFSAEVKKLRKNSLQNTKKYVFSENITPIGSRSNSQLFDTFTPKHEKEREDSTKRLRSIPQTTSSPELIQKTEKLDSEKILKPAFPKFYNTNKRYRYLNTLLLTSLGSRRAPLVADTAIM